LLFDRNPTLTFEGKSAHGKRMRENEQRWKELCELAAKEQDPKKLIELTRQINDLLLFKQKRVDSEETQKQGLTKGDVV
jgi:hypothetical protein